MNEANGEETTTWIEQPLQRNTVATESFFADKDGKKGSTYMASLIAFRVDITAIQFLGSAQMVATKKTKYKLDLTEAIARAAEAEAAAAAAATSAVQQAAAAATIAVQQAVAAAEPPPAPDAPPKERALRIDSFQTNYQKDYHEVSISHTANVDVEFEDEEERPGILIFNKLNLLNGNWKAVVKKELNAFFRNAELAEALRFLVTSSKDNFEVQLGRMLKKYRDKFIGTILQPYGASLAAHGYAAEADFGSLYAGSGKDDQISVCFQFTNDADEHLIIVPQKEPACPKNRKHTESDVRLHIQNLEFFRNHFQNPLPPQLTNSQALLLQAMRAENRADAKSLGIADIDGDAL